MLIDDSQDMRSLMRLLLESEGYEVEEANDGKQALKKLAKSSAPNLIFLDYHMPVMNGPEFVLAFEKKHPDIFSRVPVILLTALDSVDVSKTHATEVVNKKQSVDQLVVLAQKYLKNN